MLLHKLPDLVGGDAASSQRISCRDGHVQLGPALAGNPEQAVHAMQMARASELEWLPSPGEAVDAAQLRMVEQLALAMLQLRMVDAHKRDSQMEDAERMAKLLIAEEEESKAKAASKAKKSAKNAKKKKKKKGKKDKKKKKKKGK